MDDPDEKDEVDFGCESFAEVGGNNSAATDNGDDGSPAGSQRQETAVSNSSSLAGPRRHRQPNIIRRMSEEGVKESPLTEEDLPQTFQVKYLGSRDASGLWGIKHTRKPVDALVRAARDASQGAALPLVKVVVSRDGVAVQPDKFYSIDTVSYGVQDLVYTRVFSMIVVRDGAHPFECHGFVCDSRYGARRLTYALAAAFQEYSKTVRGKRRFAIDLRTPEELGADSEA